MWRLPLFIPIIFHLSLCSSGAGIRNIGRTQPNYMLYVDTFASTLLMTRLYLMAQHDHRFKLIEESLGYLYDVGRHPLQFRMHQIIDVLQLNNFDSVFTPIIPTLSSNLESYAFHHNHQRRPLQIKNINNLRSYM